mmetsp:Transcript_22114/g.61464  ORF Transcript_22114/g.61464 Transcript_22114/m.61464 type:complete len:435 (+) Transcript_22114:79-1383(+)
MVIARIIFPLGLTALVVWLLEKATAAATSLAWWKTQQFHGDSSSNETELFLPSYSIVLFLTLLSLVCALLNVTSHAWVVAGRLQGDTYVISILFGVGFDVWSSALYGLQFLLATLMMPARRFDEKMQERETILMTQDEASSSVLQGYHLWNLSCTFVAVILIAAQWHLHVRALYLASHDMKRLRAVVFGAHRNLRGQPGAYYQDHVFAYTDLGYHMAAAQYSWKCLCQQAVPQEWLFPRSSPFLEQAMTPPWIWARFTWPLLTIIGLTAWWSFRLMHTETKSSSTSTTTTNSSKTSASFPLPSVPLGLLQAVVVNKTRRKNPPVNKRRTVSQRSNSNSNSSRNISKERNDKNASGSISNQQIDDVGNNDERRVMIPICHCPVCQGQQAFGVKWSLWKWPPFSPQFCHLWFQSFGQLCHILETLSIVGENDEAEQ